MQSRPHTYCDKKIKFINQPTLLRKYFSIKLNIYLLEFLNFTNYWKIIN